jgi:hypothetical protein
VLIWANTDMRHSIRWPREQESVLIKQFPMLSYELLTLSFPISSEDEPHGYVAFPWWLMRL